MSQVCSGGINNIVTMYNHAYNQGYQVCNIKTCLVSYYTFQLTFIVNAFKGVMDWQYNEDGTGPQWCSDFRTDADRGFNALRGNTANGVVNFPL